MYKKKIWNPKEFHNFFFEICINYSFGYIYAPNNC